MYETITHLLIFIDTSKIPVCMYHGTPAERAELRKTVMALPASARKVPTAPVKKAKGKTKGSRKGGRTPKAKAAEYVDNNVGVTRKRPGRPRKSTVVIESDDEGAKDDKDEYTPENDQSMTVDEETGQSNRKEAKSDDDYTAKFPVVLTTYEMIIKDRAHLQHYQWGYIVVDEGHRLKNLDCKLMKEIKKYSSAGRMILTGTPLHVRSTSNL